jgi:hypothetical protein
VAPPHWRYHQRRRRHQYRSRQGHHDRRRNIHSNSREHAAPPHSEQRVHDYAVVQRDQPILCDRTRRRRPECLQRRRINGRLVCGKDHQPGQYLVVPQHPGADPPRNAIHGSNRRNGRNGRRFQRTDDQIACSDRRKRASAARAPALFFGSNAFTMSALGVLALAASGNSCQPLNGNLLVLRSGGGGGGHVFRIQMSNPLAPHSDERL